MQTFSGLRLAVEIGAVSYHSSESGRQRTGSKFQVRPSWMTCPEIRSFNCSRALLLLQGVLRAEHHGDLFADFESDRPVPAIDNGESESAGRHRVLLRRLIFVKSDLNTGNFRPAKKLLQRMMIRLLVTRTVRAEQYDAITRAPLVITIMPAAGGIEIDDGIDPTRTVQIRPLIGEA